MHPSRDRLAGFLLGTLDDTEAMSVTAHVASCKECEMTLSEIDDVSDTIVDDLRQRNLQPGYEQETPYQKMLLAIQAIGHEVDSTGRELQSVGVYEVGDPLGEGGMGRVYEAFHTKLKRRVALKVLRPDRLNTRQAVMRFEREMETVGRLDHPNIVQATDAGEADGLCFLVMELIKGCDLSKLVSRNGPLEVADACELVRQAAVGLQHAHEHGLVHRDIKPSNLMLTVSDRLPDGTTLASVKILDLGLATLAEHNEQGPELTATEQVVGTLAYMAPEQARSSHLVDVRADIFSLGATLYKLLTGEHYDSFEPSTSFDRLTVVPTALLRVLRCMLAANPDDRYATAVEVADALKPFTAAADLLALLTAANTESPSRLDAVLPKNELESQPSDKSGFASRDAPDRAQREDRAWGGTPDRTSKLLATIIVGLLVIACYFAAPHLFRIVTNQGQLVVEAHDHDVEVTVKKDGRVVRIVDAKSGKGVTLRAGTYQLVLSAGAEDLRLETDQFTLTRNGKMIVRVSSAPPIDKVTADRPKALAAWNGRVQAIRTNDPFDPQVAELRQELIAFRHGNYAAPEAIEAARLMSRLPWPTDALRREEIPPTELLAAGQGNPANAPPELVAVLGDSRLKHWVGVYSVAFGSDGTLHSAGANGVLRHWNTNTGEPAAEAIQYGSYPAQTAFSRDGSRVAVMSGGKLQLIDRTGEKTRTLSGIQHAYNHGLAWSPDGETVAKGNADGTISLFEVETGTLVKTLQGHDRVVRIVAFSPDGKALASTGQDETVRWWPLDGRQPRIFRGHTGRGMGVVFTSDGRKLVSASDDGTLRVWSIEDETCLHVLRGHARQVHAIAIAPDGTTVASTSADGAIKIWDIQQGTQLRSFGIQGWPNALDFSADGTVLAQAIEGSVLLWDVRSGARLNKSRDHEYFISSVDVASDGRMVASTGKGGTIQLVDLTNLETVHGVVQPEVETASRSGFNAVAFVGDTKTIAAAERTGIVRVWGVPTGELQASLDAQPSDQLFAIATSADGTTLASCGPELYLWDLKAKALLHAIPAHRSSITAAAFAPDGRTLVTGGQDQLVRLWDVATGGLKQTLRGHAGWVMSVAVSPEGNSLASVGWDHTVRLWEMPSGELRCTLTKHLTAGSPDGWGQFASVAFSPDGSQLASSAYDGTVRLWNPRTNAEVKSIKLCHPYGLISQVAFTPDGRHLVTANGNGTVYVLRLAQHVK